MKKKLFILFLFISGAVFSQNDTLKYIFIGHCYQAGTDGEKIDYRVENLDFSKYNQIWLGGDICASTTRKYSTLIYANSVFGLSNPTTLWTLGNHDVRYGNLDWIELVTKRETFYASYSNGITYIVLNTNFMPNNCFDIDNQFEMISNVCDTISKSSHLVVLMHHGIWKDVPGLPPPSWYANLDLKNWKASCNDTSSTFVNSIYPMLVDVQNRGVDVVCIMGDVGAYHKKADYTSTDGIKFLGCGFYHDNSPEDLVIIFEHIPKTRELFWHFELIDSLIK